MTTLSALYTAWRSCPMPDATLDITALADVLRLSPSTVKRLASQQPHRLPPPVAALLPTRRWAPAAVEAWLAQQSAPARRVGRPRG